MRVQEKIQVTRVCEKCEYELGNGETGVETFVSVLYSCSTNEAWVKREINRVAERQA
jgi:hypothetical protein